MKRENTGFLFEKMKAQKKLFELKFSCEFSVLPAKKLRKSSWRSQANELRTVLSQETKGYK